MLYEELVRDFAARTLKNLEFVENAVGRHEVYESTQLINSMLGLLIFPVEQYVKKIDEQFGIDLELHDSISKIQTLKYSKRTEDKYQILILMRNAFSHKNIRIKSSNNKDVTSLVL